MQIIKRILVFFDALELILRIKALLCSEYFNKCPMNIDCYSLSSKTINECPYYNFCKEAIARLELFEAEVSTNAEIISIEVNKNVQGNKAKSNKTVHWLNKIALILFNKKHIVLFTIYVLSSIVGNQAENILSLLKIVENRSHFLLFVVFITKFIQSIIAIVLINFLFKAMKRILDL